MTRAAADRVNEFAAAEIRNALLGKRCWGAFMSFACTIGMDLGRKVPRDPQAMAALDRSLAKLAKKRGRRRAARASRFVGESHVIVWCSWRIEGRHGPIASADSDEKTCEQAIARLTGKTMQHVDIQPGWNLRLAMTSGLVLNVFPDHVGESASFDGNWELWRPDQAFLIGTDLTCRVIDRENRPMELRPEQGRWRVSEKVTT